MISEIFQRSISRNINPAVVASNRTIETIETEIEEYVLTDDLINKLFLVVDLWLPVTSLIPAVIILYSFFHLICLHCNAHE